ncbi:MAG: cytochrome c peroxidase [Polyangiaceae bacterium]
MRADLRRLTRAAAALTTLALGCDAAVGGAPGAVSAGPVAAGAAPSSASAIASAERTSAVAPLVLVGQNAAEAARARAVALADRLPAGGARGEYLALRRQVAAGAPYWRRMASSITEPLLGPLRSSEESGGALLALDGALAEGNDAAALAELTRIRQATTILAGGLDGKRLGPEAAVEMLSDAAWELGLVGLEANGGVPDGHDAVLADMVGLLEAIELGATAFSASAGDPATERALGEVRARVATLRAPLRAAVSTLDLVDRAAWARETGQLGVAVRALGTARGLSPRLPYGARYPVADNGAAEPVSVLTLPAPRRRPDGSRDDDAALIALGARLFADTRLSADGSRSCRTCHAPERGFADGLARPRSLDASSPPLRHVPTLLYAPLAAVQMWDGRTLTPEAQARNVIHSTAEMGLSAEHLVKKLQGDAGYRTAFAAMPGGVDVSNVARALVAWEVATLVPGDAPLDRFARGEDAVLDARATHGFDVFVGKARCARCHIPPAFAGTRPRDFAVPVYAAIGVPEKRDAPRLDPDRGRALVSGLPADEHAFKTPTVRNGSRTAPYFHNGSYPTLAAVVDFYDKGGGRGLGMAIDNQDPEVRPLRLRPDEREALLVFLRTSLLDRAR